jgi:rod shape determining protein RodA
MQVSESRKRHKTIWKRIDWGFLFWLLAIATVGITNLYSIAHATSGDLYLKQSLWLGMGLTLLGVETFISYEEYKKWTYFIFGLVVALLIGVLVAGIEINGSRRWLDFGVFLMQPSELLKIGTILVTARYFDKTDHIDSYQLRHLVYPLGIIGIGVSLVLLQPDLGTSLVILAIFGSMVLFESIDLRSILIVALSGIVILPAAWNFGLHDYQKQRVTSFLNFSGDRLGQSWQTRQALIAIGSGRISGKGFLEGTQVQKGFVPEYENDFIIANWAEEHGFIGTAAVLFLYAGLILWSLLVSAKAPDRFGRHIGIGFAAFIFWHVTVNIGMVTGLLPVVGLTLPMMSYGGSSFLTVMIGAGLVHSVSAESQS